MVEQLVQGRSYGFDQSLPHVKDVNGASNVTSELAKVRAVQFGEQAIQTTDQGTGIGSRRQAFYQQLKGLSTGVYCRQWVVNCCSPTV